VRCSAKGSASLEKRQRLSLSFTPAWEKGRGKKRGRDRERSAEVEQKLASGRPVTPGGGRWAGTAHTKRGEQKKTAAKNSSRSLNKKKREELKAKGQERG